MEDVLHTSTFSSAIAGAVKWETGRDEGERTGTGRTEPPQAQQARVRHDVEEEAAKQSAGCCLPDQDSNDSSGVETKAEEAPVAIISDDGEGGAFATAGDVDDGLGRSLVQPVQPSHNTANGEHHTAAASLTSPISADVPLPVVITDSGDHSVVGGRRGRVDEECGGESGRSEEPGPFSNLSDGAAATNSADSTSDEHCVHCTASCWFACPCACHAALAETSSVAAEIKNGITTRRRAPATETFQRKKQRNGRKQEESAPDVPVLDVDRAFLASSESGPRPRAIHFGTAARHPHPFLGQCSGGDDVAGARVSYDTRCVRLCRL